MNKKILLENYNRDYLIQGITVVDDYFFITSYYKNNFSKKSVISIYDKNYIFVHRCELDTNSHVGGIAYDNIHDIIWVSDNGGTVTGYKKSDIFKCDKVYSIKGYKKIPVAVDLYNYRNKPAVSYLTYYNNKLYLGNFVILKNSELRCFDLDNDGKVILSSKNVLSKKFGRNIQGIYFKDDCVMTISSYGKYINSKITYYKIEEDNIRKVNSKYIDVHMAEQFTYYNNKLIVASEIGGNYYLGNKAYDIVEINIQ